MTAVDADEEIHHNMFPHLRRSGVAFSSEGTVSERDFSRIIIIATKQITKSNTIW